MLAEMVAWQPPRAGRPAGSISSRSIAVSRNRLFLVGLLPRRQVGTQGWSVAVEQRDVCGALTPLQPTRPTVNERSIDVLPMPGNLICYRHRPDFRSGSACDIYPARPDVSIGSTPAVRSQTSERQLMAPCGTEWAPSENPKSRDSMTPKRKFG